MRLIDLLDPSASGNRSNDDSVQLQWLQTSIWKRQYQLFASDTDVVGEAAQPSIWRTDLDLKLYDGQRYRLRFAGGLFKRKYQVGDDNNNLLGGWESGWGGKRKLELQQLQLQVASAGLFSPRMVVTNALGVEIARTRTLFKWFKFKYELRFYPQHAPELRPADWMVLALLLLHIHLINQRRRSSG